MAWYWWVLIVVAAVVIGYVKLKVFKTIMSRRKSVTRDTED